jgi:hypothetical protein
MNQKRLPPTAKKPLLIVMSSTTVQLYQEPVILPDDGYAEFLLLVASRR